MQMYIQKPRMLAGAALATQALGKIEEATGFIEEARHYSEEGGFMWLDPLIALADGRVSLARGDSERALEQYKLAETLAGEMGMRHIIWQAQLGAAQLLRDCGNAAEASATQENAQRTLNDLAASFNDRTYKEAFLESTARKLA